MNNRRPKEILLFVSIRCSYRPDGGMVDCTDASIVRASFGQRLFLPAPDLGRVDAKHLRDLSSRLVCFNRLHGDYRRASSSRARRGSISSGCADQMTGWCAPSQRIRTVPVGAAYRRLLCGTRISRPACPNGIRRPSRNVWSRDAVSWALARRRDVLRGYDVVAESRSPQLNE
jgi:hypothetical protein